MPCKTLLFTAWVGEANGGEAAALKTLLAEAFAEALIAVQRAFGRKWSDWMDAGRRRLERKAEGALPKVADVLRALCADELTSALAGKHQRFVSRLSRELEKRACAIDDARDELFELEDRRSFEAPPSGGV